MSEDNTLDLTQDEKLNRILAELSGLKAEIGGMRADICNLDARLTSLEAKVDERLYDTRPLWEVINARTEKLIEQYGQMAETLRLIEKQLNVLNEAPTEAAENPYADETCEKCGRPMILKRGRFGQFLVCTGYPECENTRKITK